MHWALSIGEIRTLVCNQLHRRREVRTLFHLALTSHSWTEPALNVLWTEADDAKMIFSLFSLYKFAPLDADEAVEVRTKE